MADVTVEMGTPICWADATDYVNTASGISRTHQLDLTSVAAAAARQGAKADLGANRAGSYAAKAGIEFAVAPVAGTRVEFYWSSSFSGTAGTGNDGGVATTGADAAWAPGGGAEADIDEFKRLLIPIGYLAVTADATTQVQVVTLRSRLWLPTRYGQPIIKNATAQAFVADAVEMYFALIPNNDDVAAS